MALILSGLARVRICMNFLSLSPIIILVSIKAPIAPSTGGLPLNPTEPQFLPRFTTRLFAHVSVAPYGTASNATNPSTLHRHFLVATVAPPTIWKIFVIATACRTDLNPSFLPSCRAGYSITKQYPPRYWQYEAVSTVGSRA